MFESVLWSTVALFAWTVAVLVFCYAFIDLTRRAFSGWPRVAWISVFVILPIVGPLAYVAVTATRQRREEQSERRRIAPARSARSPEDGRVSSAEVAALKRQFLRY